VLKINFNTSGVEDKKSVFNHLPGLNNFLYILPRMSPGILDLKASGFLSFEKIENNW
jgi:hypothetical protein